MNGRGVAHVTCPWGGKMEGGVVLVLALVLEGRLLESGVMV